MNEEPTKTNVASQIESLRRFLETGLEGIRSSIRQIQLDAREESSLASDFRRTTSATLDDLSDRSFPREMNREDLESRVAYIEGRLEIDGGK